MQDQLSPEILALEPVHTGILFPLPGLRGDPTLGVRAALGTSGNASARDTGSQPETASSLGRVLVLPVVSGWTWVLVGLYLSSRTA